MRKICFIILILVMAISCEKSQAKLEMEGTLTGTDPALCPCCGGVILTLQNQIGNFRIDSLPFMSVQKLYNLNFPIRLQFNYSRKDTCGGIIRFRVTDYFVGN